MSRYDERRRLAEEIFHREQWLRDSGHREFISALYGDQETHEKEEQWQSTPSQQEIGLNPSQ